MVDEYRPDSDEVFVISEACSVHYPDLDLELPAGVPVQVPESFLSRILEHPGVVQAHLNRNTPEDEQ